MAEKKPKRGIAAPLRAESMVPPKRKTARGRAGVFRFITDDKAIISTKKMLASLANQHVQNSVAFVNRSAVRLREAIHYLQKLDVMEKRLLGRGLLDDDADEQEDHHLVNEVLVYLDAAQKALEVLRLRKIEAGIAFEEAIDPIYKSAPGKKAKPFDPDSKSFGGAQPITMELVETPQQVPPPPPAPGTPPPIVVKFDDDLLRQAREEVSKALELEENEI